MRPEAFRMGGQEEQPGCLASDGNNVKMWGWEEGVRSLQIKMPPKEDQSFVCSFNK